MNRDLLAKIMPHVLVVGLIAVIVISVFVALGGPLRNMFSTAVSTGTMGHNQASLAAGIYDESSDPLPIDREQYAHIAENEFREVGLHPLTTFSIDVDRASYANVRRFLASNTLPPIDAVRVEELINYFPYRYDPPAVESEPFAIHTEAAVCPWRKEHVLVKIGLKGREMPRKSLPPSNFVFLIDVSGSMQSPDKLPLVKSALGLLVDRLSPADRVAIVVYAGASGLVLPSTPGGERSVIREAIDRLEAGGSTAGAAGIELAYKVAEQNFLPGGNNRVILATDGDFNVGPSSDGEMVRLIEEKRAKGVFLSVLGFGTGNLQDAKMERIADHGNGNYAYIDGLNEAKKVLVTELGGTLHTIAKDVKIQVEFNPRHVKAYRLIGYENRVLAPEDFDDDKKDAGELGEGHTVTALYEVVPAGADEPVRSARSLRYQSRASNGDMGLREELLTVELRYKLPEEEKSRLISKPMAASEIGEASSELKFAAAVAEFGMLLRESKYKGEADWTGVLDLARAGRGPDEDGIRTEFIELAGRAASIPRAARGVRQAGIY